MYIASEHLILHHVDEYYCELLTEFIIDEFTAPFGPPFSYLGGEKQSLRKASQDLQQIIADPEYLYWALLNVEFFCMIPDDLEATITLPSRRFTGFTIEPVSRDVISFMPAFTEFQLLRNEPAINANWEKYDSLFIEPYERPDEDEITNRDAFDTDQQYSDFLNDG